MEFPCSDCSRNFNITEENAILFLFTKDSEYSYLRVMCTFCEQYFSLVLEQDDVEKLVPLGLPTMVEEHAPDEIQKAFEPFVNADPTVVIPISDNNDSDDEEIEVPTYELSPRQEQLVADLGVALAETPDDLLMDLFGQPPPKSNLPKRWA